MTGGTGPRESLGESSIVDGGRVTTPAVVPHRSPSFLPTTSGCHRRKSPPVGTHGKGATRPLCVSAPGTPPALPGSTLAVEERE